MENPYSLGNTREIFPKVRTKFLFSSVQTLRASILNISELLKPHCVKSREIIVSAERKTHERLIVCGLACGCGCVNYRTAYLLLESLFFHRNNYNVGSFNNFTKGSCYLYTSYCDLSYAK